MNQRDRSPLDVSPPVPAAPWGWRGLYLWRTVSAVLAAALLAGVSVSPICVRHAVQSQTMAALQDGDARTMLIVITTPGNRLRIRPIEDLRQLAGTQALELWALPAGGSPRSLGLVSLDGGVMPLQPGTLDDVPALAVSQEPPGGSPNGRPSGPVLLWGMLLGL